MRKLVLASLGGALALPSGIVAAEELSRGAHTIITPKKVAWSEAPPSLPRGAQAVVLYGDPSNAGVPDTIHDQQRRTSRLSISGGGPADDRRRLAQGARLSLDTARQELSRLAS
ncbi:MAG: hypothetical protein M3Q08_12035 [Pseudomonadota bacterium]|nr:hypothetical protein [Pseudomonadota bacterium]